ncbi:MAG: diguanylate cyclase [Spirochaetes bacterium]|nr:diguanylate cyclase [Spirochaetota bacterium]
MELKFKTNDIIDQRYQILDKIGEGGMSLVFKARDRINKTDVAIKFLKQGVTSSYVEDVIRFKREVEAVSKFSHPNIVRIHNAGEYKNIPYIIMELLTGRSLAEMLMEGKEFGVKNTVLIIEQLAQTLSYVHSKGIIHRDLKPGNIMISGKYKIKLLDFGVAFIMELGQIKSEEEVVGTFGYMSPEATGIVNKRVDERSDLYSLGIVFYRLLTGSLPFQGKEMSKILHQQVAVIPPKPSSVRSGISSELEEMVLKLLNKEPELRYQSAKGLIYDLQRYEKGDKGFIIGEKDQKIKISYQTRLVGREAELSQIQKLFNKARDGRGSVCLVAGDPGVGKSRLVEEIRAYCYQLGGMFIGGRCLDQENKIPYQPYRDAINGYIRHYEKMEKKEQQGEQDRLGKVLGELGEIIIRLNNNMARILGDVPPLVTLDSERENQRFMMVASRFFCSLGSRNTACVLFLDDLQWADEGSLRLLEEMANTIGKSRVLVMGTFRDNEVGKDHGLNKVIKLYKKTDQTVNMIKLLPFSYDRLNNMLATLLGEKEEKAYDLTKYVFDKSGGNPFFAVNIVRELVEEKALVWKEGYWEENWKKINSIPVSVTIIDIILRRIEDLAPDLVDVLCLGSVIGREFEIGLLYKMLSLQREEIVNLVDDAIEKQLLERSMEKGKILFVHDRIRDAFYDKIAESARRKLNLKIAVTLEELNQKNIDNVIFDLAHHYTEGGNQEKALQYVIPAALKAKGNYANEEAIKYFNLGIKLLEKKGKKKQSEWMGLMEGLAEVYLTIGKLDEAIKLSKEILALKKRPVEKASVYRKIGVAYFKKGEYEQCENNLVKGLELLGERVPRKKAEVVFSIIKEFIFRYLIVIFSKLPRFRKKVMVQENKEIIWIYLPLGWMYIMTDVNKCVNTILKGLNYVEYKVGRTKEFENLKEHGLTIAAYAALFMSLPIFKVALKYLNQALEKRKKIKDEWGIAQNLQWLGVCYMWKGDNQKSIDILKQSKERFQKIGDMWEVGMVLTGLGRNYRYIADYSNSIDAYEEYLDISERINNDHGISEAQITLSYCYTEKGDFEQAEKWLIKGKNLCEEKKNKFLICYAYLYYGFLEIERRHYSKAIVHLEQAKEVYEDNTFLKDYTVYLYVYLAEAYIENFRIMTGSKPLRRKTDKGYGSKEKKKELKKIKNTCLGALRKNKAWPNHYGAALRVAAKYYALVNKKKRSARYFTKSIQHIQTLGRRYELAKSYFEFGNFLVSLNREGEAKEKWEKAYSLFKEIGAKEYIKHSSRVLGIKEQKVLEESPQERLKAERRMTTVLETSRYLSSILDLDELLERIIDKTIEMVGAERGILLMFSDDDKGDRTLEVKVVRNVEKAEIKGEAFGTSRSIIEKVAKEKKALIIEDAGTDAQLKAQASVVRYGLKSILCAPIMARGDILGVIYLDNHLVSGLFSQEDLMVLDLVSSQAGVSIENARLYKRAVTDGLTGLYNRIFFDNYLMQSVNESSRYNKDLSLMLIDIDYFKTFNDKYGHQTGDKVIRYVSDVIKNTVRKSDIAARYGGDEFVIILSETSREGASIAAEKIRKGVKDISYSDGQRIKNIKVTLSIGVAEMEKGMDRLALIQAADKALYKAKEKGRDRVEG